jgi:hypothetical protein
MTLSDPTHVIFLDDSGSKEYLDAYDVETLLRPEAMSRRFRENNYFVIAGLVVPKSALPAINSRLVALKRATFNDPSVEIKSEWLRNPYQRQKHYQHPYGVSSDSLNAFGIQATNVFGEFQREITLVACVFDKRYYSDRKNNDPFCSACQVVLERVQFYMQTMGASCILVSDQMESDFSVTRGRHGELVDVYLNRRSMKHVFVRKYTRIADIEFRSSANENLIQLADLAAYNIYRQFVEYGTEWEDPSRDNIPYYSYFTLLMANFLRRNDKVVGSGLCKLPDVTKVRWF